MAFTKGQSGNPKGRPPAATIEQIRAIARRAAPEMIDILIGLARDAQSEKARSTAASCVLDRAYGKPAIVAGDGEGNSVDWVDLIAAARKRSDGDRA